MVVVDPPGDFQKRWNRWEVALARAVGFELAQSCQLELEDGELQGLLRRQHGQVAALLYGMLFPGRN